MNHLISNFETLLAKGQDNAMLRFGLGMAYLKENNLVLAIQHFAKAIEFDPHYSAAWKNYGKALAANGQIETAVATYQKGIEFAEQRGDLQAAKEMKVFLKRLEKSQQDRN